MKLLVLGGTVFLGRHVVDEALTRGHDVTIYSRGLHGTPHRHAQHIKGDRADVTPLHNGQWDAAIDTSGFEPGQVQASASLDLGHYVFVSSVNAYPDWPDKPVDEDSPTWQDGEGYGPGKAASERVAREAMGGRFATVRAGLIVGPSDNIFRLPWWIRRIAKGGAVPAPGDPDLPIQLIDARDLARFCVDLAEQRVAGAFNGTGPIGQTTFGALLRAAGDAELVWIPDEKLVEAQVAEWTELPMWLPAGTYPGTWRIGTTKAKAAGLRTRPIAETVRDTRAWLESGEAITDYRAEHRPPEMSAERAAALLRLVW